MPVQLIDGQTVAIAGGRPEIFGLDVWFNEKVETLFREHASLLPSAAIHQHVDVETHVARVGRDAARTLLKNELWSLGEFAVARVRTLVMVDHVVLCRTLSNVTVDGRLGGAHA